MLCDTPTKTYQEKKLEDFTMKDLPAIRIESTLDYENVIAVCAFLHELLDYCSQDKQYKFELSLSAQKLNPVHDEEPPF